MTTADVEVASFSPVENEAPLRWWRRLGLAGAGELGVYRRAALFALVCWLPIVGWALATGRLRGAGADQSLLAHYSIHVRCLIAIPLLIVAEEALHRGAKAIAGDFVSSGLVTPALRPEFDAVMRGIARLRDNALPWLLAIGVAVVWAIADPPSAAHEEMSWSVGADGSIGLSFEVAYGHAFKAAPRLRADRPTTVSLEDMRAMVRSGKRSTPRS